MNRAVAFIFVFAVMLSANIVFAALPTILVDNVNPQPVEPGKDLTIDVTFYNRQSGDTGDFYVTFDARFPIILKSSTEDFSKLSLCGFCKNSNKYFLSVDPSALSGTYPIFLRAYTGDVAIRQQIDIKVQGKPNLVFSADNKLDSIIPDSQFTVVLDIMNVGSGQAKQIKIQPDSASFIVLGGSIKTIDMLNPNQTKRVDFDFVATSSLEATSYSIPFKISYLDDSGTLLNTTQNLGVKVINKGEINIQTVKITSNSGSPVVTADRPFTVVVRLENIGKGDADSVTAEVNCPFNGPKKSFLGQLKRDEDAPAVFDFVSPRPGSFTCDLKVSYKDDTGAHQFNEKFDVRVEPADYSGSVVLLLVIIVVIFLFRKRIFSLFRKKTVAHHK